MKPQTRAIRSVAPRPSVESRQGSEALCRAPERLSMMMREGDVELTRLLIQDEMLQRPI
jgi:hypothetical protein